MKAIPNLTVHSRRLRRNLRKGLLCSLTTAIAALLAGPQSKATTFSWITAGDGNWNVNANWAGGVLPGVIGGDTTLFNAAGVNANENIYVNATTRDIPGSMVISNTGSTSILGGTTGSPATNTLTGINNITINAGAGPVNFGSSTAVVNLSMDATSAGYVNQSSNLLTFYGTINTISTTRPLIFGGSGDTLLLGALIGGRNITKNGGGTVTITAASVLTTSTAAATVDGGILKLVDAATLPSVKTFGFSLRRAGTLLLDNSGTTNSADRLDNTAPIASGLGGGTFSFQGANDAASTETVAALTSASGVLTVNSVLGADTVAAGTPSNVLTFSALGTRTAGSTLVFSGASLGVDGTNKIVLTAAPTLTNHLIGGFATIGNEFATYNENGAGSANTNGVQAMAAAGYTTTFGAANNVKLTDSDSLALDTAANSLNLQTASGQAFTVTTTLATGAILNSNSGSGTNSISGGTIGNGTSELIITANSDLDISSSLTGNGILTKSGAGTVTLSGSAATRTTANVFINQGRVKITSATALYDTSATLSGKITVGVNATLEVATNTTWTTSGKIPALTLNDKGATLKVSGNSTFTFDKNIVVPSLLNGDATSVNLTASTSGDTIQLNSAVQNATASTTAPLMNVNGLGTVNIAGAASNATVVTSALNGACAWNVSGGGKLLVTSTGTNPLGLAGNSVIASNGILGIGDDATTNYAYTLSGGTLSGAGGGTRTIATASTIKLDAASTIDLKDAAVSATANMNLSFGGAISGTGALTVNASGTGSATLTLGGTNTFSGNTKVNVATLALTNPLALQNSAIDTSGSGVIDVTGVTTLKFGGLIGGVDLTSVITTGYGSITELTLVPGTGVTNTYSGAITNGASGMTLTLSGAGKQVLSGTNLYSGATTITSGTLALSGSGSIATSPVIDIRSGAVLDVSALSGVWTVGSGQTLMGNGTLLGTTSTSGIVAPGASVGNLAVTGGFTFASGSKLNAEIVAGTLQVETATAAGTAAADGDVVATVVNTSGTLATLTVPILTGDTADVWAAKVIAALQADTAVTALYTVGGTGAAITLTRITAVADDPALNIALANGVVNNPGITEALSSANTTAGVASGGTDLLAVSGALDVTGATLNLTITGTLSAPAYVIATYGSVTSPFSVVNGVPGGYIVDYAYNGGTAIAIKQGASGDVTPPVWNSPYPMADTATSSGFTAHASTDEASTVYYIVLASGASGPSNIQVKAGNDASDLPALKAGSFALAANTPATAPVTGLTPGTTYDVWFVAEDAVPNLQAVPVSVSVTTLTTFAEWIGTFSVGGLTGLTDDFDNDGKPNFLEFALNSSPASGSSQGKVFIKMATVGVETNVLTLTVAVRNGAAAFAADGNDQKALDPTDSLTYIIEAANTLTDWGTPVVTEVTGTDATTIQAGLTPPAPDAGWTYHTFRTDGSSSTDSSDFIRVKVTTP